MALPPDFKELLVVLNRARNEYPLVGGCAVSYHGYPRPTDDLDLWVAIHSDAKPMPFGWGPRRGVDRLLDERKLVEQDPLDVLKVEDVLRRTRRSVGVASLPHLTQLAHGILVHPKKQNLPEIGVGLAVS